MSLLGNLVSKILHPFGGGSAEAAPSTQGSGSGGASSGGTSASGTPAPAGGAIEIGPMLDDLAQKNPQKLDWRHSIVDLMKLLDLDSSLSSRKGLADELHYTGDKDDSATMNVWLHKQVMQKVAENGGKVPEDLKH